jgi:F5/8 type C domain
MSTVLRRMGIAAVCVVSACAFACSAYDNADTPGHALGSGGTSTGDPQGGDTSSGGTLAQGGTSAPSGGASGSTSGLAGSAGQAGTGVGGGASGGVGGASGGSSGSGGSGGSSGNSSAGSAGTGGGSSGAGGSGNGMCSAHPLTAMSKWTVTTSNSSATDVPAHAIDGDLTTRWSSGKDQAGDEWLQLDFSADVTVTKVTLKLGSNMSD